MANIILGAIDVSIKIGAIKLSLIDILLHLLNLVILVVALTFLLYKPILKFINKRKETIENEIKKGEEMQRNADEKLAEYQAKLDEAQAEAEQIKQAAIDEANQTKQRVLDEANDKARMIYDEAGRQSAEIKQKAVDDVRSEVTDTVITIATEVIKREISKEDNQKLIDDCLEKWSSDDGAI